jgi:hypothetical protein
LARRCLPTANREHEKHGDDLADLARAKTGFADQSTVSREGAME